MNKKNKAFTLLEILLVVTLIAILVAIVIVAINPAKQIGETNNTRRAVDINTILSASYQYAIDNNGQIPPAINQGVCPGPSGNEICKTGAVSCTGFTNLSVLTNNEKYLVSIPIDPLVLPAHGGTGYFITRSVNNRITVCAPNAQLGTTISITR